jgi:all-trans-8'-apo-beta-carotenal 15,15'-oxygenase
LPYAGLVTSLPEEHDYVCEVDGDLPPLEGTLYRVGPGLYDRGPDRRRMVLDGDGLLQALSFSAGQVRFRNRYVRTRKYLAESSAGRFLYPTFSTHGSGPLHYNLGLSLANQANTTVIEWAGRVFAFDESQRPYALNRQLDTLGESSLDPRQPGLRYWAHWKLDAAHRQLHLLAILPGPRPSARVVSLDLAGRVVARQSIPLPRSVYIHDWFVTRHHFAFVLHPAYIDPAQVLQVLIARQTFSEAIRWQPERGNVLQVARRGSEETQTFELEPCWMWHAINGYESGQALILDFIGARGGGGLGNADDSPLFGIMRGEPGLPEEPVNYPRRYRVDMAAGKVEDTILDASANYELPSISATERSLSYSHAYMIQADAGEIFARSLCQLDGQTLQRHSFGFEQGEYVSEPVMLDHLGGERGRYVISQIYNASERASYFAIFDDRDFAAGPLARIRLRHHVPLSFHGYWSALV